MINIFTLTENQIDNELEKGYEDLKVGRTKSVKKVFADIRKDYGILERALERRSNK